MLEHHVICTLFLFLLCSCTANGTVTPSNIAVVAGDRMTMECRTISGSHVLMWELDRPTSSSRVAIFRNHDGKPRLIPPFSSRFGFDMDESCSGLLYTNTTRLDDAGRYICRIDGGNGEDEFSAYLTVLESEPICETNYTAEDNATLAEGDRIWMQCTVNFRGMWAPRVEWKQHTDDDEQGKDDQEIVLHGVSTVTDINSRVTSTLIPAGGSSKTTHFSCRIFFSWHNGSVQVTATNIPNFTFTWKSPRLVPHREKLKTTEQVYIAPLPVEVRPFGTTTPKPTGSNDWYIILDIISLILFFAVLVFVSLLVGLGIRRYVRFRRVRDLNVVYNASTSSTAPLRRLERPSSGEYDLTPTATPNIYDRIDGAEADDDVTAQAMASQNQCDPQLTQCYSGLMAATSTAACQYDTLDPYEKMDLFDPETDSTARKTPEGSNQENGEERYTTPVPKRGVPKPNLASGSKDYLEMVGDAKKAKVGVTPLFVDVPNDSDEDNYPDGKLRGFAEGSDDHLQPGPKAVDNCPTYIRTDRVYTE